MTKVIIIEDEAMIRVNLEAFLEDEGYDVVPAGLGEEGLQIIENDPEINVAIVDVRLPDIEGTNVVIRANQTNPNIKFIIYTGSSEYTLPDELKKLGMEEKQLLYKPLVEMSKLTDLIEELLA